MQQQNDSILKASHIVNIANDFCDAPLDFANFRSEIWTLSLNRTCEETESLPINKVFFFFFQRSYVSSLLYFFGWLYRSCLHLSNENKEETQAGFPVVGWCMISTAVSKKITSKFAIFSGAWSISRKRRCISPPPPWADFPCSRSPQQLE